MPSKIATDPSNLINLERYPMEDSQGVAHTTMVARFAADLRDSGICRLEGFLRAAGIETLCAEANGLATGANYSLKACNPYFTKPNPALPEDDARNIMTPRCLGMVAGDLIPEETALKQLYRWEPLHQFLSAILGHGRVYVLADRYQCLNISVIPEGPGHNWHFDDPDFVVTLMLQKPEGGGDFECVPGLRSPENENYDGVREVLLGARDEVKVVPFQPGTLMIFRGRYALHRVSPVVGRQPRLIAVLSYSTEPEYYGSDLANRLVYGERVEAAG
jgi:hypothetical protein